MSVFCSLSSLCSPAETLLLLLIFSSLAPRGARLIPEMDQVFTEVEMTTLEKVINDTWVSSCHL